MPLFTTGNPVAASGQLNLVAGCDYKAADGNAAVWTNAAGNWQNLTGAAVYLLGYRGNLPIPNQQANPGLGTAPPQWFPPPPFGPIAGTVVTPAGTQQVSFDVPAVQTGIRPSPSPNDLYSYVIFAVLSNGDTVPLQTGPLAILGIGS